MKAEPAAVLLERIRAEREASDDEVTPSRSNGTKGKRRGATGSRANAD